MNKFIATALITGFAALSAPLTFAEQGATAGVSAVATTVNESTGGIAPSKGTGGALGGIGLGTLLTTAVIIAAVAEVSDGDDSTTGTTGTN